MKTLKDIKKTKNQRALVRVDYNVPFKNGKILDPRRINASFETIKALHKKGFQTLLVAHLGDNEASLRPVAKYLSKYFKVVFLTEDIKNTEKIISLCCQVSQDTVIVLENIRKYREEELADKAFAKSLSSLASIYVNDAFSVSHRNHASITTVSKLLPSFAGIQIQKEISSLSKVLNNKKHPFLFILGGAKFATKIPLIKKFALSADSIVITGAILNSFYKVAGFEVGSSVVEDGFDKEIKKLLSLPKILLPVDVIVLRSGTKKLVMANEVQKGDVIVDIGRQSVELIKQKIQKSKLIVWNGPTGWYEKGFVKATKDIATEIANSKSFAVVGGGDTGALVEKIAGNSKNVFVSTGGGATLEYLANGGLIGLKYLK